MRADMQLTEIIDPGDRSAAIADLDQIDHRHHDRVAGGLTVALDPVIGLDRDLIVFDQRAFGGGAADVERQDVRLADDPAKLGRAPEAGGRAAFDHGDRNGLDGIEGIDAAIRLHDEKLAGIALAGQAAFELLEITLGLGLNIGREDGGVGALIFAPLAGDLVRCDHRYLGPARLDFGLQADFVVRVGIGVQQADGDRLYALGAEQRQRLVERGKVQRRDLVAVIIHPLDDLAAEIALHERGRLLVSEIEEVRPVTAADLDGIAKALGGDQPDLGALALGQRVDDDRGAMGEEIDRADIDLGLFQNVENALFKIRRRGVGFFRAHGLDAGFKVGLEIDEVGEGAADIGRDARDFVSHEKSLFNA